MKLTLLLILINVTVFVYTAQNLPFFIGNYGIGSNSLVEGRFLNVITAMFLHANILHLAGNMFVLFLIGSIVEKHTTLMTYLTVYFLSGILPNLGILLLSFILGSVTAVGASGAISGLIGFGAFKLSGKWVLSPVGFPIPMPFILAGALFLLMNLSAIFIFEFVHIANLGHLFGGVIGASLGLVGERNKRRKIVAFLLVVAFISLLSYLITSAVLL